LDCLLINFVKKELYFSKLLFGFLFQQLFLQPLSSFDRLHIHLLGKSEVTHASDTLAADFIFALCKTHAA